MKQAASRLALAGAAILFLVLPGAAQTTGHSAAGASIYKANCATCHGDDGSGSDVGKSLHVPDLRSAMVQSKSNAELARFIGQGSGAMPAFSGSFDHRQILEVVHHVRALGRRHRHHA